MLLMNVLYSEAMCCTKHCCKRNRRNIIFDFEQARKTSKQNRKTRSQKPKTEKHTEETSRYSIQRWQPWQCLLGWNHDPVQTDPRQYRPNGGISVSQENHHPIQFQKTTRTLLDTTLVVLVLLATRVNPWNHRTAINRINGNKWRN